MQQRPRSHYLALSQTPPARLGGTGQTKALPLQEKSDTSAPKDVPVVPVSNSKPSVHDSVQSILAYKDLIIQADQMFQTHIVEKKRGGDAQNMSVSERHYLQLPRPSSSPFRKSDSKSTPDRFPHHPGGRFPKHLLYRDTEGPAAALSGHKTMDTIKTCPQAGSLDPA
jgi:hypothetical protein